MVKTIFAGLALAFVFGASVVAQTPPSQPGYPTQNSTGGDAPVVPGQVGMWFDPTCNCSRPFSQAFPLPIGPAAAAYTETTVTVSASTWTLAVAANATRKMAIVGDATGVGCILSFNASPIAGEGFAFSLAGSPGAWTLDTPIATNAIYVKCAGTAVVTIMVA